MPDEFPTLEAAALLGVVVLALRTYLLLAALRAIPKASARIVELLKARDRTRATAVAAEVAPSAFTQTARLLLLNAEESYQRGAALSSELERDLLEALALHEQRNQSARGRDLVLIAVLLGASLYAAQSPIRPSAWFFGLCLLGVSFIAVGFVLRQRLLGETERELHKIVGAIADFAESAPRGGAPGPCLACDGVEHIVVPGKLLGEQAGRLGLSELRICRTCGLVQGQVEDPKAIPISKELGTSVVTEPPESASELQAEEQEHEG